MTSRFARPLALVTNWTLIPGRAAANLRTVIAGLDSAVSGCA